MFAALGAAALFTMLHAGAAADSSAPLTTPQLLGAPAAASQVAPTLSQQLDSLTRFGENPRSNLDSLGLLRSDPEAPLALPLSLQTGKGGGLSFLYYAPPALTRTAAGKAPQRNTQSPTYGFSNALALGGSGAQLKGLFYLSHSAVAGQGEKSTPLISQALSYARDGWNLQAHYQSIDKNFSGFDALSGAAPSMGLLSSLSASRLKQLEAAKGKTDLGFTANYAAHGEHFGIDYGTLADQIGNTNTQHQALSFGKSFAGGLSLDANQDVVHTEARKGVTGTSQTVTTNNFQLGFDPGRGASMKASFLTTSNSRGLTQTTQNLQMAWRVKPSLSLDGFLTLAKNPNGTQADARTQQVHLAWQLQKNLTFDGKITQAMNSQWAHANDQREFLLKGLIARNTSINAHLVSKTDTTTGKIDATKDLQAIVTLPRFAGMERAQWMLTIAQRVAQGELESSLRALSFDAETHKNRVHLEYAGNTSVLGKKSNHQVSRALRIVSDQPKSWLQYDLAYKARSQSDGPELPDIRNYQASMQIGGMLLQYHYFNQIENPNGTITDLVQTTYHLNGHLDKSLLWTAELDHTDNAAGTAGVQSLLLGVKGNISPTENLELAYGHPEARSGSSVVDGQTYKVDYQNKVSADDYVAFNGQMTQWDRKTPQTPVRLVATVRLDVKKVY